MIAVGLLTEKMTTKMNSAARTFLCAPGGCQQPQRRGDQDEVVALMRQQHEGAQQRGRRQVQVPTRGRGRARSAATTSHVN